MRFGYLIGIAAAGAAVAWLASAGPARADDDSNALRDYLNGTQSTTKPKDDEPKDKPAVPPPARRPAADTTQPKPKPATQTAQRPVKTAPARKPPSARVPRTRDDILDAALRKCQLTPQQVERLGAVLQPISERADFIDDCLDAERHWLRDDVGAAVRAGDFERVERVWRLQGRLYAEQDYVYPAITHDVLPQIEAVLTAEQAGELKKALEASPANPDWTFARFRGAFMYGLTGPTKLSDEQYKRVEAALRGRLAQIEQQRRTSMEQTTALWEKYFEAYKKTRDSKAAVEVRRQIRAARQGLYDQFEGAYADVQGALTESQRQASRDAYRRIAGQYWFETACRGIMPPRTLKLEADQAKAVQDAYEAIREQAKPLKPTDWDGHKQLVLKLLAQIEAALKPDQLAAYRAAE